jgi:branched-chain amino acid transport system substrate-binding protein
MATALVAVLFTTGIAVVGGVTTASAATANATETVVVGDIGDFSGLFQSSAGAEPGVLTAWAKYTNAHGGLNGEKVKVVNYDVGTATSPAAGLTDAQKLVSTYHPIAIVDGDQYDSGWLPYVTAQHIPVVGAGSISTSLSSTNLFPPQASLLSLLIALAQVARTEGPDFGLIACVESTYCTEGSVVLTNLAPTVGLHVNVNVKAATTSPNYTAQCEALKSNNVNSYVVGGPTDFLKRVVAACYAAGVRSPTVNLPIADSSFEKLASFGGTKFVDYHQPFFSSATPALATYRNALKQYLPHVVGTVEDNDGLLSQWMNGLLIGEAVRAAGHGNVTGASVTSGLYKLKNETLGGLAGPLTFTPGKVGNGDTCYFVYTLEKGRYVTGSQHPKCESPSLVQGLLSHL